MTALAFDLGDTLVEYEGLPPSWEAHYPEAVSNLARFLNTTVSPEQSEACAVILRTYNTRITPRETEIQFSDILKSLSTVIDFPATIDEIPCATAFFSIFRQRLRAFPDSIPALVKAAQQKNRVGVFTDVPYGMPRELVEEDLRQAGIADLLPVVVTSIDAGFRKPRPETMPRDRRPAWM